MANLLNRPVGKEEKPKERIIFILSFGLFIFLFLFLFKPFGLEQLNTSLEFFLSLGFGFITAFVLIIFKFLIEPAVLKVPQTLGKNQLWNLLIATCIGVANYFFVSIVFSQGFIFKYFLMAIWTAILVGVIPVTMSYFVSSNKIYQDALKKASVKPEEVLWTSEVTIMAGNPKNEIKLSPEKIIYLCSNDNYVTIVHLKGETVTKTHLRGTLMAAEKELKKNSAFFRCHKCYIINSEYVSHLTGNRQNMKIKLKIQDLEIPVSRAKATEANKRFRLDRFSEN